jgi:oligopeptide/dipeptide ABC transporter ATP-binding protein
VGDYPHQLSGGMRQRVMIAMALSCGPKLLVADEPTTALDVTTQAQVIEQIVRLQREFGMAMILITHDLGIVAESCQQAVVMYCGSVIERSSIHNLFARPHHPYTAGLLASIPRITDKRREKLPVIPGMVPDLLHLPDGCRFADRCSKVFERCREARPPLEIMQSTKAAVACYDPNV